jgi:hypothetical protein
MGRAVGLVDCGARRCVMSVCNDAPSIEFILNTNTHTHTHTHTHTERERWSESAHSIAPDTVDASMMLSHIRPHSSTHSLIRCQIVVDTRAIAVLVKPHTHRRRCTLARRAVHARRPHTHSTTNVHDAVARTLRDARRALPFSASTRHPVVPHAAPSRDGTTLSLCVCV